MAKISIYPSITSPEGDDILIGTDKHHFDATKNFVIADMFLIGLETSVSKLNIYDSTLMGYGQMLLDNDTIYIKGAPTNTRNLLVSSATGYMSFKKNNLTAKFDAAAITANRTWTLPNYSGTVALVETTDLQQVTDAGNSTTLGINLVGEVGNPQAGVTLMGVDNSFGIAGLDYTAGFGLGGLSSGRSYDLPDHSGTLALVETTDLQQVTNAGNTTNDSIIINDLSNNTNTLNSQSIGIQSLSSSASLSVVSGINLSDDITTKSVSIDFNGLLLKTSSLGNGGRIKTDLLTTGAAKTFQLPNQDGTLALQSAASGSFVSQDGKTITVTNGIITSIV